MILVTQLSSYKDPNEQNRTMTISTTNYCKLMYYHPDLTQIIGIPTYNTLHLLRNEQNTMQLQSTTILEAANTSKLALWSAQRSMHSFETLLLWFQCIQEPVSYLQWQPDKLKMNSNASTKKSMNILWNTRIKMCTDPSNCPSNRGKVHNWHEKQENWPISGTLFRMIQYLIIKYGKTPPRQLIDH